MAAQEYDYGMIGLGTMGRNLVYNMCDHGYSVAGFDKDTEKVNALEKEAEGRKVTGAHSLKDFIDALKSPKVIMLLVPAGHAVDAVVDELKPFLSKDDLVMDCGNSHFTDTDARTAQLEKEHFHFMGVGISGGEYGARFGPSIMPGGSKDVYERVAPMLKAVSAKVNGEPCVTWLGPGSAGHYVKMVHNGIEYGMMQAMAEGLDLLKGKEEYNLDLAQITELWRHGSVVRSWLLDLTADALKEDQELAAVAPYVADSGEGRWTVMESVEQGVAVPVLTLALQMRFASQDATGYSYKLLSMMRNGFGGHFVKSVTDK